MCTVPCLEGSSLVVAACKDHDQTAKQLLAVLVDERAEAVKAEDDGVEEEGEEGGPVHLLQLPHQLRQHDQSKVAPEQYRDTIKTKEHMDPSPTPLHLPLSPPPLVPVKRSLLLLSSEGRLEHLPKASKVLLVLWDGEGHRVPLTLLEVHPPGDGPACPFQTLRQGALHKGHLPS